MSQFNFSVKITAYTTAKRSNTLIFYRFHCRHRHHEIEGLVNTAKPFARPSKPEIALAQKYSASRALQGSCKVAEIGNAEIGAGR